MALENDLLVRVERLERQNLRIKLFGGLVILSLASLFIVSRLEGKKTVEAHEFLVKDQSGRVVARLGSYEWATCLELTGKLKVAEAAVCVGDDYGSSLTLANQRGDDRTILSAGYWLRESSVRVPGLIISGGGGKKTIRATLGAEPEVFVGRGPGEDSIVLSVPQKEPRIKVLGAGGKPLWSAP